jgi:uncharacterized membrane protein YoaK (UPF0700 family)
MLSRATILQVLLMGLVFVFSYLAGNPVPAEYAYPIIVALSVSMGLQNATARKLAVPDLTTTVLTLTMTGIFADSRIAGGSGSKAGRRVIAVVAMFIGALVGVLAILYASIVYPLALALLIIALVSVASWRLSTREQTLNGTTGKG